MTTATLPAARVKQRHTRTLTAGREWRHMQRRLEIRSVASGEDDTIVITGSPIVYGVPYSVCDWYGEFAEVMHPGVATAVLAEGADVRFLFNHDGMPLARTTNGTLVFVDTATELQIIARLSARSQLANDLAVAVERGDVDQMSCGFVVARDAWSPDYTQRDVYTFSEFFDVSAVTYPASPTTSVQLAHRMLTAVPVESRARLRNVWKAAREARDGKILSEANATLLMTALDALHAADDIDIPAIVESLEGIDQAVDIGQGALATALDVPDPDGDADDLDPALVSPDEAEEDDPETLEDDVDEDDVDEDDETDEDGSEDDPQPTTVGIYDGSGTRAAQIAAIQARAAALRLAGAAQ